MKKLPSRRHLLPLLIPCLAVALVFVLVQFLIGLDSEKPEIRGLHRQPFLHRKFVPPPSISTIPWPTLPPQALRNIPLRSVPSLLKTAPLPTALWKI